MYIYKYSNICIYIYICIYDHMGDKCHHLKLIYFSPSSAYNFYKYISILIKLTGEVPEYHTYTMQMFSNI